MASNWKFEKFLFKVTLNNNSIIQYSDGKRIRLVHERNFGEILGEHIFDTKKQYKNFMDETVSHCDGYNNAWCLGVVLDKLFGTQLIKE